MGQPQEKVWSQVPADSVSLSINTVARKLRNTYGRNRSSMDYSESVGWAQLGVVMAGKTLRPEVLASENWPKIRSWLIYKGFWNACDLLREAGVVDRTIDGVLHKRSLDVVSLEQMDSTSRDGDTTNSRNIADSSRVDPSNELLGSDFMSWAMGKLIGGEFEIIHFYYQCQMSMRAIGVILGLSEASVSQSHAKIINRLRLLYQSGQASA